MELLSILKTNKNIQNYAFDDLVDEYGGAVYKFCRSLTYSKEDADDLFQETFLKVLEQLPKINASDNPKSFLFSTALYLWKSLQRKYARRNRLAPMEPLGEIAVSNVNDMTIEEDIIVQEDIRTVRELVDALPEKLRIPTILFYTIEMGVSEIASTLEIPDGTVKSRLHTARKLIEEGLVKIGYEQ